MLAVIASFRSSHRTSNCQSKPTRLPTSGLPPSIQPPRHKKASNSNMASTTSAPLIPDQILPDLYLSDIQTARAVLSPNYQAPNRPKIRYVLSLLNATHQQPQTTPDQESNFVRKLILLRDSTTENLLEVLGDACGFIKSSLANKDGGILIHCHQGVSRSASVVLAFVMEDMDLDFDTALRYVRGSRSKVNPNPGFVKQLEMWRRLNYSVREADGELKQEYADFKTEAAEKAIAAISW